MLVRLERANNLTGETKSPEREGRSARPSSVESCGVYRTGRLQADVDTLPRSTDEL